MQDETSPRKLPLCGPKPRRVDNRGKGKVSTSVPVQRTITFSKGRRGGRCGNCRNRRGRVGMGGKKGEGLKEI